MPQPTFRTAFRTTTAHLSTKLGWWWRKEASMRKVRAEGYEWPALLYEIGRRTEPEEFPEAAALGKDWPPFAKLPAEWQADFASRWPDPNLKTGDAIRIVTPGMLKQRQPTLTGWTKAASLNLGHSTAALLAQVEKFIEEERKRIRKTAERFQRGNKPLPWESVEMFDVQQHRKEHPQAVPNAVLDYSSMSKMKKLWQRHKE